MSWDGKYAYWFTEPPDEALSVLDATTGKLVHSWPLGKLADIRRWDTATSKYVSMAGVNINTTADWEYSGMMHVVPDWHSNIVANGYVWFLTVTNNNDRWAGTHTGPPHCLGRVNVETGKAEYLELPVGVQRSPNAAEQLVYGRNVATTAMDSKGNDVAMDNVRSHTDGWSIPAFYASPDHDREQALLRDHPGDHVRHRRQREGPRRNRHPRLRRSGTAGADLEPGGSQLRGRRDVPPQQQAGRGHSSLVIGQRRPRRRLGLPRPPPGLEPQPIQE